MPLFGGERPKRPSSGPPLVLSEAQKLSWLRLLRTPSIGPATFWRLINYCGGAEAALAMLPELFRRARSAKGLRPASLAEAEDELRLAQRHGAELVARGETGYPALLAHVQTPPPLLYIKGRKELAAMPAVALVGSRNASVLGEKYTRQLAGEIGRAGYVVVSGLARGIDAAAHRASLANGTIASIAGGIGNYYPPQNRELQQQIEADGLVVTECLPEYEPRAQDFPRRNRIIAGCSLGTVVIEANLRSGSLITARLAGELGREVMAVPGHPLDPRAAGTNRLIRNGALLIETAADVIEAIASLAGRPPAPPEQAVAEPHERLAAADLDAGDEARTIILDALGHQAVAIDDVIAATRLPTGVVRGQLLLLEIEGLVVQEPAQMVRRTAS
jgi:DNA processing protein